MWEEKTLFATIQNYANENFLKVSSSFNLESYHFKEQPSSILQGQENILFYKVIKFNKEKRVFHSFYDEHFYYTFKKNKLIEVKSYDMSKKDCSQGLHLLFANDFFEFCQSSPILLCTLPLLDRKGFPNLISINSFADGKYKLRVKCIKTATIVFPYEDIHVKSYLVYLNNFRYYEKIGQIENLIENVSYHKPFFYSNYYFFELLKDYKKALERRIGISTYPKKNFIISEMSNQLLKIRFKKEKKKEIIYLKLWKDLETHIPCDQVLFLCVLSQPSFKSALDFQHEKNAIIFSLRDLNHNYSIFSKYPFIYFCNTPNSSKISINKQTNLFTASSVIIRNIYFSPFLYMIHYLEILNTFINLDIANCIYMYI